MKAVLLSIKPKYCELIASGKKTVEVRKTRPKLATPFKVYIYETKGYDTIFGKDKPKKLCVSGGRVIGEFVCDSIDCYTNYSLDEQKGHVKRRIELLRSACMTLRDWRDYIGSYISDFGYAWHISDLIIYDTPKELSEFLKPCKNGVSFEVESKSFFDDCLHCPHLIESDSALVSVECDNKITRPPQSWFYVEEVKKQ